MALSLGAFIRSLTIGSQVLLEHLNRCGNSDGKRPRSNLPFDLVSFPISSATPCMSPNIPSIPSLSSGK